jgi:predicted RNA-binding protein with PIN domain
MSYLVDGHNLIPKIPGMSLESLDDEQRLIELLQVFCRVRRQVVEVFFDQAPPGRAGRRLVGVVVAHFVRQGRTADESIVARLDQLEKAARNWTVVTSDRQVQGEARARQARVISSDEFAGELAAALQQAQSAQHDDPGRMSDAELNDWLKLFGG